MRTEFSYYVDEAKKSGLIIKVIAFPLDDIGNRSVKAMEPWRGESTISAGCICKASLSMKDVGKEEDDPVVDDTVVDETDEVAGDEMDDVEDDDEEVKKRLVILRSGTGDWGNEALQPLVDLKSSVVLRGGSFRAYKRCWRSFVSAVRNNRTMIVLDTPNTELVHFMKHIHVASAAGYNISVWRLTFDTRESAWDNRTRDISRSTFDRINDKLDEFPYNGDDTMEGEQLFRISDDGYPVPREGYSCYSV